MLTNPPLFLPRLSPRLSPPSLHRRATCAIAAVAVIAAASLATAQAPTGPVQLRENAPERHTVVKGDTLWGISGRFLNSPWRWPDLWRMNREQIKNPHWIYPGQVMVLDRNAVGGPTLSILQQGAAVEERGIVRLSPQIRSEAREGTAIPSIAPGDIEPFMSRNRVVGAETFDDAPQIVKSVDARVAFATADLVYAVGIKPAMGKVFMLFRKGRELRDPSITARPWYKWRHNERDPQIIGYEATYLGDAKVLTEGDVAKLEIVSVKREVQVGDYLIPQPPSETMAYVPRAPEAKVEGLILTLPNNMSEAGKTDVVTLNLGKRDGLEAGHVLAVFKPKETFNNPRFKEPTLNWIPFWPKQPYAEPVTLDIPEERVALVFVFRVFEGISYGLVMNSGTDTLRASYIVRNP